MAIPNLSEQEFKQILRDNLTPASAISNPQHLKGRSKALRQIERAFNSPGCHVFIFGDRGVGKTSLAQSAAILHQSSDNHPIVIACDQSAGFFKLVQDMARRCILPKDLIDKKKAMKQRGLSFSGISLGTQEAIEKGDVPVPESINDAINLMRYICDFHSHAPVVIIDEFDQLKDSTDRKYFADLIKQVSDQQVPVRFIFCGIGSSLENLIGVHLSTDRYLTPIELERLSHDARWEIIEAAASAMGLSVHQTLKLRIGQISDGFPYYVHLIGQQMFWSVFDDAQSTKECRPEHFNAGVSRAVEEAQTSLKLAYEKATQKYSDDYQEVLWAVADDVMFRRQVSEIYKKSYQRIMAKRQNRKMLHKTQFYNRMNALKGDRHGNILESTGAGWYQFKENVVRGYVRLQAEKHGVVLGDDHFPLYAQQ